MALAAQPRASSIPAKNTVFLNGYDITSCERLKISETQTEILVEIDNVKTYDEGEYTLMLEYDDGVFTTSTFARVHYAEDEIFIEKILPKISRDLINVTSIEGQPLDLTFTVDCKTPFDVLWMKDDEIIIDSDDFA